jgi:hypothetical protein
MKLLGTFWLVSGLDRFDQWNDCSLEGSFLTWRARWQEEPANSTEYGWVFQVDGHAEVHVLGRISDQLIANYVVDGAHHLISGHQYEHAPQYLLERFEPELDEFVYGFDQPRIVLLPDDDELLTLEHFRVAAA